MVSIDELRDRTDWKNGLISPFIHFDDDVYREEQARVFGRAWLVVGHEDMLRKPGDYVTNYMGEVPVIVVRDLAGAIHVFLNKCAHRGVEVCLFDRGNARGFTCSYHGWSYDLEGKLVGVPMERAFYGDDLDRGAWGLEAVANVATFNGLILATFDPQAPSLAEWLGPDVCWWLETFVLAKPFGGLESLPGWHRNTSPGNWKLISENFIGDDYHVFAATHVAWLHLIREFRAQGLTHPMITYPAMTAGIVYEGSGGYERGCPFGMGLVTVGEAADLAYNRDLAEAELLGADAVEWVRERHRSLQIALKDREHKPYSFMNGLLFPNFGLMGFISPILGRHFLQFHPRGPLEHEVWQWTMVERAAPQSVKDLAIQRVYQGQHMAGLIAPDDVENFERLVEAMRARRTWDRPFHYGMRIGHEQDGPRGLPGNLGPNPSEANQRQFYKFWLGLMERPPAPAEQR